ncbi:MAG: hypothetical protein LBQ28_01800 [Prevotellaceae bacterium]|nr:hypothetical protein [Prevotellaceae bacterium]
MKNILKLTAILPRSPLFPNKGANGKTFNNVTNRLTTTHSLGNEYEQRTKL